MVGLQDVALPNSSSCDLSGQVAREMSESTLYVQLSYFSNLLDVSKALQRTKSEDQRMAAREKVAPLCGALEGALSQVHHIQGRSKFGSVNLAALLSGLAA